MAHALLVEIGTEELPASFVRSGLESLEQAARELFTQERLSFTALRALGTPRRLALLVEGLEDKQPDHEEQIMGPPSRLVFDDKGALTKQGIGFAQKYNVTPEALQRVTTDKGEYVAVKRSQKGQPTATVLQTLIPQVLSRISFSKTMRWGEGDIAFGRPIHWLVGLLGENDVAFEFAGIKSGRITRGHRFLDDKEITLKQAQEYPTTLAKHHVWVDGEERLKEIRTELAKAAKAHGAELIADAFLESECLQLVEAPFVVPGTIDAKFLSLPEEVIIAVMRNHQRYFGLREPKSGKLSSTYLNVVNTALDPKRIAAGNDRVLRARLADAAFFVQEDKKVSLQDRVTKLDQVVWQQKLGSVGDKVRRIEKIVAALCDAHKEIPKAHALQAAALCKSDLNTHIVFEFPELQGHAGYAYALNEGLPKEVATALRDYYKPTDATSALPESPASIALALADRADSLVGCFGIGLKPTGSADPFALRRAAISIARIARDTKHGLDISIRDLFETAYDAYPATAKLRPKAEVLTDLDHFLRARLEVMFAEIYPQDVVAACIAAWDGTSLLDLESRMQALRVWNERPDFGKLTTAFKRVFNIAADAKRAEVQKDLLEAGAEQELHSAFSRVAPQLAAAGKARNYQQALELITVELGPRVDSYFEKVFVMADDPKIKANRLALLAQISDALTSIAHFHMLAKR